MLKIVNPATEALVQEIETDTPTTLQQKMNRAQEAQKSWLRTPLEERKKIIHEFKSLLLKDEAHLSETLTSETGKPITQARGEIRATGPRIDFFLDHVSEAIQTQYITQGPTNEEISYEPLGVVGNISAWNYPYFVGTNVFIPALLTGSAVLYKPSEFASLTGLAIGDLFQKAGLPAGLFEVIIGEGAIGAELLRQPIDGIFFTGSYPTGVKIAQAVAPSLMKVQLELGGKDPLFVADDVDIPSAAASTADGAFYNTGQSCCSVERIYVHEKIYESFLEAFLTTVRGFQLGDPLLDTTYIGPLTRKPQISVLEAQIRDATQKGARIELGGKALSGKGYFFEPTVLSGVNHTMEVMREESFGPIIGIQKVSDDAEALEKMNDTSYGLTAGVFTQNKERAVELMRQLNAGSVYWNCCDRVSPPLPWSGRKRSGLGLTLSLEGIRTFLKPKAWHLRPH